MKTEKKETKNKKRKIDKNKLISFQSNDFCLRCEGLAGTNINCGQGRYFRKELKRVDIMIVGDSVNKEDIESKDFFSGRAGQEISSWIQETGLQTKVIYFDNAIRCNLDLGNLDKYSTQNKKKLVKNCRPYLLREIERLKPKVIIPLGNIALQMLIDKTGIVNWRGNVIRNKEFNCFILPTFHPYVILIGNYKWKELVFQDLLKAKELLTEKLEFKEQKKIFLKTEKQVKEFFEKLNQQKEIVIDIETIGIDSRGERARIIGISFSYSRDKGYFLPVMDSIDNQWIELSESYNWKKTGKLLFGKILSNKNIMKIAHNAAFELEWFRSYGFDPINFYDTMIGNEFLSSAQVGNSLKSIAWIETDGGGWESEIEKYGKKDFSKIPVNELADYAISDAITTFVIYKNQKEYEKKSLAAENFRQHLQLRENLSEMESVGIPIDLEKSQELSLKYADLIKKSETDIQKLSGCSNLNVNSSKQIIELLWDKLFSFSKYRTKFKKPSSGVEVLETLLQDTKKNSKENKILTALLTNREYSKLKGTYIDRFLEDGKKFGGKIYTHFNSSKTRTGRLSSSDPNFQNIPRGSDVRGCVVPIRNYVLWEFDYSQLELRIAAEYCQDSTWIDLLNSGADTHAFVGKNTIKKSDGSDYDESDFKDGELRAAAKIIGFSMIYGKTSWGLAKDLKITEQKAKEIIDNLFSTFPKLLEWIKSQHKFLRQNGFVQTLFGRELQIPNWDSDDEYDFAEACRKSVNYPVQGAASSCVIIGINRVYDYFRKHKIKAKIHLTVHDSIMFSIPEDENSWLPKEIKRLLEMPISELTKVKLYVDAKSGKNWGEMQKVKL